MREARTYAPGRINLIGEHTDYQDGYVLPCAIPQRTYAAVRERQDQKVHARSTGFDPIEFQLGHERKGLGWGDFIQGLTWVLAAEKLLLGGFELELSSDVPVGSGLSSSAALTVATLRALRAVFELELGDVDLARLAQRAEVEFVGAPVGIMDQMAASLAKEGEALFLDTRAMQFERIPLPQGLELAAIDSGLTHKHAGGEYAQRRRESEEAATLLGVPRLRDLDGTKLSELVGLPPTLARRARHIVTENARVIQASDALRSGNLARLGALINESHASLRDDYEVSLPPVDQLVAIAQSVPGVFGARMTGGGFGGAILIAVAAGAGHAIAARVSAEYSKASGLRGTVLLPRS